MEKGTQEEVLLARVARKHARGLALTEAQHETGWTAKTIESVCQKLVAGNKLLRLGTTLLASTAFTELQAATLAEVKAFQEKNRLSAGVGGEQLRKKLGISTEVLNGVLGSLKRAAKIEVAGETVRLPGHTPQMNDAEATATKIIEDAFAKAGLKVPFLKEVLFTLPVDRIRAQKLVTLLLRDRVLIKVGEEMVFHAKALEQMRGALLEYKKKKSARIDVGQFKELTGVSRKYAIPLLEWLDRERITRRDGDVRIIL
jgi:selenocysteine-specific elongation factor